jgi:hypothetical protein
MTSLQARYPHIRKIDLDEPLSPEDISRLVEPYQQWELVELDGPTCDILIGDIGNNGSEKFLILGHKVATTWLAKQKSR